MLSNFCYQIFVIEIYNCFVIKSFVKNSFKDIIEHDDDIAFFSFSMLLNNDLNVSSNTTTILHSFRFHKLNQFSDESILRIDRLF